MNESLFRFFELYNGYLLERATLQCFILYFVETFPFSYTPWYLAAWNAMAVDQHVEKPEVKKSAQESVAEENVSSEESAEDSE